MLELELSSIPDSGEDIRTLLTQLDNFRAISGVKVNWARDVGSMPVKLNVLAEIYPLENPLHDTVMQSAKHGRAYHTVSLWRKIEYQIAQELGACLQDAVAKQNETSEAILRAHIEPLARRLNLTWGN